MRDGGRIGGLCVKVKRFDGSDLVKLKRLSIYDFAISKTSYASTYEISSWKDYSFLIMITYQYNPIHMLTG